jgi:hypothetical protein
MISRYLTMAACPRRTRRVRSWKFCWASGVVKRRDEKVGNDGLHRIALQLNPATAQARISDIAIGAP